MSDQVSLIRQASCEHRSFALDRLVTVDVPEDSGGIVASAAPSDPPGRITAPDRTRPAVDVVLPFRDTIDFVNESLPSVLEQAGVDVVVHLVDDASTTDTSRHLDDWARDPRIRIYRNLRNLGPYVSFNNVSRFFETDFVAIQDADDISLPHRLRVAVASLQTGRADIFGAAVEMFGDDRERPITTKVVSQGVAARLVPRRRYSRYPASDRIFAVLNGSAVMRTQEFVRLGGFADYGDPEHNRCGLDSEFYARAHFAGCHFFISREIVLRNRRHAQSATQNSETGWGTARRMLAREKLLERIAVWQRYEFDPRDFGGLDRYADLTERIM